MSSKKGILSIDQGTTSTRAIVFDVDGKKVSSSQKEFCQYYPNNGWVEHDPEEIWKTTLETCKDAIQIAQEKGISVEGIGITNQRETTLVWDRTTGKAIYNAIVWQDRRTAAYCNSIKDREAMLSEKTGLLLDPYFSASKVKWLLDEVEGARKLAEAGKLAFGTIDTFLIWRLTGGEKHLTDTTNASRTNLFNIHTLQWDDELLSMFDVPPSVLPKVMQCADDFGCTQTQLFGKSLPIAGVAGDQQAALIGQCCFNQGDLKSTYGTGCFALLNTGEKALSSQHKLLTTVAYSINGATTYALEGSIFTAGANIQWLRDGIGVISDAAESQTLAESLDYDHGVVLVPGFAGLGAPHWNPEARASLYGMTRGTSQAHFARAALEAVCYQTYDLQQAMASDGVPSSKVLVDGGMVANDWLCQFLSDILQVEIQRPSNMETTAIGAAYLAGLQLGLYKDLDSIAAQKHIESTFSPAIDKSLREKLLKRWQKAVDATLSFADA
ncbi:glycerol kinase GlpK [Glaciecola sp. MH2013]|uniref:glycerol kinase GlpK n=1 Tax=Glaciecola sp. MH2013 TaxID=2785524 RepID=UPI00189FA25C|nr:glycerol kinase GlpK [Glaciecola sp. MH2013]MBF7073168.1 glycerol kinase GlpK [Glaciecola sp. MH2013]